jgi:large subunit ribosomal protein L29
MKDMKAKELREKSVPELEAMIREEKAALFKARRDLVFRQSADTTGLKTRRHNIARILTVITEKQRGNS